MKVFIITIIIIVLPIIFIASIDLPQSSSDALKPFQEQVANDFEVQYAAVVKSGTLIDRCVRAGLVAEGYLQAANNDKYMEWKGVELADCKAAGVTK